jgi:hypothetical protein
LCGISQAVSAETVLAPAWPGLEGTVEEVRRNTSRYERLGIKEITGRLPVAQAKVASVALKNPASRCKTVMLTPGEFRYGFTSTLTLQEPKPACDRLAVPGPGRPLFQAAFANLTPHAVTTVSRWRTTRWSGPCATRGPERCWFRAGLAGLTVVSCGHSH